MAPRTVRGKKAADVKVVENEAPKKGRGKAAKAVEETEQEVPEIDLDDKAPVVEKKKRGKKAQEANGDEANGMTEEKAPPTKRGRKKVIEIPMSEEKETNGDSAEEESNSSENQNGDGDYVESDNTEETDKRKKQAKGKPSGKGRKPKQANVDDEKDEEKGEKPKGKGRGRKPKVEANKAEDPEQDKTESADEEFKAEPVSKGKKKGKGKAEEKETSPEADEDAEEQEDKAEEPKKGAKSRRGGKKAQPKEDLEEKIEDEPMPKKRKVNRKDNKGQGDYKDEDMEEEAVVPKPAKGKRVQKKAVEVTPELEEEPQDTGEVTKRRRKPVEEKAAAEETKSKAKNKTSTNYEEIKFSNNSKDQSGKEWNFKIASWNVDGIRAWMSKGGLDYIKYEKPDILCLQETKCSQEKLPDDVAHLPGYHAYWCGSDKEGYAGVGIYTAKLAISVTYGLDNEELDDEGRLITAEYEDFYLICTYVPNAGRNLVTLPKRLRWNEEFRKHVKRLDKTKPVIICGDMNVAHTEIDLTNPKTNKKNAGFTPEERAGMTELLGDGFVDSYRCLNPDKTGAYTFWTYMMNSRAKNVGWRLDYFIVSERLMQSVCDHVIRDQVYGSDHCPIALFLHLTSADKPKE